MIKSYFHILLNQAYCMRLYYPLLLTILCFNCSNFNTNTSKLIDFVPHESDIIIKTSNLERFKNSLNNNDFLQKLSKSKSFQALESKLNHLKHLKPKGHLLLCLNKDDKGSIQYTIITKHDSTLFITDSLPNYMEESLIYKNKTITKSTLNDHVFYSALIDSVFFASSSKTLVESAFKTKNDNIDFNKIYTTVNDQKEASIFIKPKSSLVKSFIINDTIHNNMFTEFTAIDLDISPNTLLFNGITKASDSSKSLIHIFKNSVPQEHLMQNITPSNSDGFLSFTFHNFEGFKNSLNTFNKKDSITNTTTLFDNIYEVGVIYEDKNRAVVLNSLDITATKEALLSEQHVTDTYRQVNIYSFSNPALFYNTFKPLVRFKKANQYCILNNFLVFSNNVETLQNIIASYQNETTLSKRAYFKAVKQTLADESSLMRVVSPTALQDILVKSGLENTNYHIEKYQASAIQFVYDTHFAHVNGIIQKSEAKARLKSVSEVLNIKFQNSLLNDPQFVTNHITKEKEIIVQDINNNLYLIANNGKILWKKQLQGPVLGKIEQIDIYRNGRLQLVFATPKRVYVLDRGGRDVSRFPITFKNDITQPLSVFDYDKNKNYRLLVIQGSNLIMYSIKAKIVSGFKFRTAKSEILTQPKHIRSGTKDYITFKTRNKLHILNRIGKDRVVPKTTHVFSNEPIFFYKNKFTTTTGASELILIDAEGGTEIKNLNLSESHYLASTSKTLVALSENRLTIKNKTIELDYGNYTRPKIFYLNDKIYVAVTDLQSQKIYLFDSQAKAIPNFPVYGNSSIELDNIDNDKNLEFVTKGDDNSIILYQIN